MFTGYRIMRRLLTALLLAVFLAGCASAPEESGEQDRAAELYRSAHAAWERGDWETAVERLESLQAQFPFGLYSEQAQLDIIYAYYELGETESAVAAAERFIRLNPRHDAVAYAYYMKGLAEQKRGRGALDRWFNLERAARNPEPLRQAFDTFQTLLRHHPQSRYAADARERMGDIRDMLATHELNVARFYVRREAWVAAATRAAGIIEGYMGTPAVGEALQILAQAYEKLDLSALSADVQRVIELNVPEASR